jgi:hypothetical protein
MLPDDVRGPLIDDRAFRQVLHMETAPLAHENSRLISILISSEITLVSDHDRHKLRRPIVVGLETRARRIVDIEGVPNGGTPPLLFSLLLIGQTIYN